MVDHAEHPPRANKPPTARGFLRGALLHADKAMKPLVAAVCDSATVEAVHELRINTRRARSALSLFRPLLARRARETNNGLREIARGLAEIRDLDVVRARLTQWRVELPALRQPGVDALIGLVASRRRATEPAIARALSAPASRATLAAVGRLASSAKFENSGQALMDVAPALVHRVLRKFRKAAKRYKRDSTPQHRHQMRIKGKGLRYALESLEAVYARPVRPMLWSLRELHDCLGEHQDVEVVLAKIEQVRTPDRDTRLAAQAVRQHCKKRVAKCLKTVPGLLAKLNKAASRELLHEMKAAGKAVRESL